MPNFTGRLFQALHQSKTKKKEERNTIVNNTHQNFSEAILWFSKQVSFCSIRNQYCSTTTYRTSYFMKYYSVTDNALSEHCERDSASFSTKIAGLVKKIK